MLKICGIGGFVFAAIAFIAWIISWLTIAIAPDSLIVSRVFASINAVSLMFAVFFIAVGLIFTPTEHKGN